MVQSEHRVTRAGDYGGEGGLRTGFGGGPSTNNQRGIHQAHHLVHFKSDQCTCDSRHVSICHQARSARRMKRGEGAPVVCDYMPLGRASHGRGSRRADSGSGTLLNKRPLLAWLSPYLNQRGFGDALSDACIVPCHNAFESDNKVGRRTCSDEGIDHPVS